MKFLNENRQYCELLVFFFLNNFSNYPAKYRLTRYTTAALPALNFYHMFFSAIDNHVVHRK